MTETRKVNIVITRTREIVEEANITVEMPVGMTIDEIRAHYDLHLPSVTVQLPPETEWHRKAGRVRDIMVSQIGDATGTHTTFIFVSQRDVGDWTVTVYRNNQTGEFDWRGKRPAFEPDETEQEDDGQGFESEEAAYEDAEFQITRDRGDGPGAA